MSPFEEALQLLTEWMAVKAKLGADSYDGIEDAYVVQLDEVAGRTQYLLGTPHMDMHAAQLAHERAKNQLLIDTLSGIYALLDPPLTVIEGKTYKFVNPMAAEVLHELSNRIRAIPDKLKEASNAHAPGR